MKEEDIIKAACNAFLKSNSKITGMVDAKNGTNFNKKPFIEGFIFGVRFYANHLYGKFFIDIIRSILDTKDSEESHPLEYEEYAILYTLKNYPKLQKQCEELSATIKCLDKELMQSKARYKQNEEDLRKQIKDLEYWLTNIGKCDK